VLSLLTRALTEGETDRYEGFGASPPPPERLMEHHPTCFPLTDDAINASLICQGTC
jgi:hypothetical protein